MSQQRVSRRTLLGVGSALSILGVPSLALGQASSRKRRQPKNIIFCVSDGMSLGVPAMASQLRELTEGKSGVWDTLLRREGVVHGLMDTRSLSSLVTDSAAASSAWATGVKVYNGMISTHPDGAELRTIFQLLREREKMKTGLVTTATVTHATPAAFAVAHPKRDEEAQIAEKYLSSGVDVILGGGSRFFSADLISKFSAAGYSVSRTRDELRGASGDGRALGLFSASHVPYEVDRLNDFALRRSTPSLAEMTEKALELLDGSSNGFVLQVEGARVDHAAHGNDVAGLLYDQLAFENAVESALRFAEEDGETLVVVTSDHGNANPGLIGGGPNYGGSTRGLAMVGEMRESYEKLLPQLTGRSSGEISAKVESALGVKLNAEELALLTSAMAGSSTTRNIVQYSGIFSALSFALSNHCHVCWSGRQHSSDYTLMTSWGPGAEEFEGLIDNTEVFHRLLRLRGLKFENPAMTLEEAERLRANSASLVAMIDNHWE